MWTPTTRRQHSRAGLRYGSDLTDAEWAILSPFLPSEAACGRKRAWPMREIVNAICYVLRGGVAWRLMPDSFPPWRTVYRWFARLRDDGTWETVNHHLVMRDRERAGREASPTAAVVDSQSVKTTESGGVRGYDAGKKIKGRKRHILVDTMGLVLMVVVHVASIQDRDGARLLLAKAKGFFPRLQRIWADGGYAGKLIGWVQEMCGWVLEIIKRSDVVKGFKLLPRRWVVERTFGWLGRYRRLSKDYERLPESSEVMVYWAMTRLRVRRLARQQCRRYAVAASS
jgi:putative transposase